MSNSNFLNLQNEEINSYYQYLTHTGLKLFTNYSQRVNSDAKFVGNSLKEMHSHENLNPMSCAWNDESDEVCSNSDTNHSDTENDSNSETETEHCANASSDSECDGAPETLDDSGEDEQPEHECSEDNEYYEDSL